MVSTALTKDAIIAAVKKLDLADRVDVYLAIKDFLPPADRADQEEVEVSDEMKAELLRRLDEYRRDPSKLIP